MKAVSFTKARSWKRLLADPLAMCDKSQSAFRWAVAKRATLLVLLKFSAYSLLSGLSQGSVLSAQKLVFASSSQHPKSFGAKCKYINDVK